MGVIASYIAEAELDSFCLTYIVRVTFLGFSLHWKLAGTTLRIGEIGVCGIGRGEVDLDFLLFEQITTI